MSDEDAGRRAEGRAEGFEQVEEEAVRAVVAYSTAVRSALRNNAAAYGYSVTITIAFGLLVTAHGDVDAVAAILFGGGAAAGFVLVQLAASWRFRAGIEGDSGSVVVLSSAIDLLSILCAVLAAVGLSRVPSLLAWPLTAAGATVVYLLVGGVDVLLARWTVRHTDAAAPEN